MASQKISQLTAITTVASGDYFPIVQAASTTNRRVGIGVLDARFTLAASGVAAQNTANTALASGNAAQAAATTALASGNAGVSASLTALSSGNAGISASLTALSSGNAGISASLTALSSGNAALTFAATKYAISGGLITGQSTTGITALGTNGSGIPCSSGNYFTATLNANSSVFFTNIPSNCYSLTYEVNHQSGTITWPTAVAWPGGTAPTLTTSRTHLFMFVTDDGGVRWRGAALVDYTT